MTIIITESIKQEIYQSINQTTKIIDKENKISFDLRNHDLVNKYQQHLENLLASLKSGVLS